MNTNKNQSQDSVSVSSFESMTQVRAAYSFVGGLTPADVAVVPMVAPKVAERLARSEAEPSAPKRAHKF